MCYITLNDDISVDIFDSLLLRRSVRRERSETRQNTNDNDVWISMDVQFKFCFFISRKVERLKIMLSSPIELKQNMINFLTSLNRNSSEI